MDKQNETLTTLLHLLNKIENDAVKARALLQKIYGDQGIVMTDMAAPKSAASESPSMEEGNIKVVEGKYDGNFMQGNDGKVYPVPMNYASKTKLIPGDMLKLRIMEDGKLVYKLIAAAPKKYLKAKLSKTEEGKFIALTDEGKTYMLNQAAVTFFKGDVGNELSIIVNATEEHPAAAIEALIDK